MGYRIMYASSCKTDERNGSGKVWVKISTYSILTIMLLLSLYIIKEHDTVVNTSSANIEYTKRAFSTLIDNLQNDMSLKDSITVFCNDMIYYSTNVS